MSDVPVEFATLLRRQVNKQAQLSRFLRYAEEANDESTCLTVVENFIQKLEVLYDEHAKLVSQLFNHDDCLVDDVIKLENSFNEEFSVTQAQLRTLHDEFLQNRVPTPIKPDQLEIDAIDTSQASLDAYMKRIEDGNYADSTVDEIAFAIRRLDELRNDYSRIMNRVISKTTSKETKTELRVKLNDFQFTMAKAVSHLEALKREKTVVPPPVAPTTSSSTSTRSTLAKTQRIPLPEFDGTPEKWIKFRDMFKSLVHDSDAYSAIEKFHYLQASMKIPASESNVLNIFPHTADNYEKAWKAVCDRYNDKRKLLNHHLTSLFAIKKMTNDSAAELRRIIDSFESHISALAQLGFKFSEADAYPNLIFVFLVSRCLEEETLKEWKKDNNCDTPSYAELHAFLIARWRSLDDMPLNKKSSSKAPEVKQSRSGKSLVSNNSKESAQLSCSLCSEAHRLNACEKFRKMSVDERHKYVKDKHLCWNCLSSAHVSKQCTSKYKCRTCEKSHHSMLHLNKSVNQHSTTEKQSPTQTAIAQPALSPNVEPFRPFNMARTSTFCETDGSGSTAHSSRAFTAKRQTLLSTVIVHAVDTSGTSHPCRALLDSGSDTCFMTTQFAKRLGLSFRNACIPITGIDDKTSIVRHRVTATIKSRYGPFEKQLECSILNNITGMLPNHTINQAKLSIPTEYFLADPNFHEAADVDMLISSDIFYDSLLAGKIQLPTGLTMLETKFGWIMGGTFKANVCQQTSLLSCFQHGKCQDEELSFKMEKFLTADEFEFSKKSMTAEEKFCEKLFVETTTRDEHGRFIVHMPVKANSKALDNNLAHARQALSWQEKRRQKDDVYDKLYVEYMEDYISTQHMTEIVEENTDGAYYLPHHGVVKMSSTTTKVRPVFNASSESSTGISLNDILCVGATVQPESFDIMLRFREKPFVITGDITKMYRQIFVHPSQRKLLRILWRSDMSQPVTHYQLNTVTFGTACAPFLATRVIKQIALDNQMEFPEASSIIERSFYVDDLLYGIDSIEEGTRTLTHIRYLLIKAGMSLCKISANHPDLIVDLPANILSTHNEDSSTVTKTLGIGYDSSHDQFAYHLKPHTAGDLTKAKVLSEIASIYDPIGWIGPVVLKAKLFLKKLWLHKLQWKDDLPEDFKDEWNEFRNMLHVVNNLTIQRHCFIANHVTVELHGFCDASIQAYGAVIYAYSHDETGHTQTSLICSKSRVAPKNQKTLARLELCGATLLAKLIARICTIFTTPIRDITLWSDSTIVLHWIILSPSKLSTFVGNRTAVIQELTHAFTWNHIQGVDNPADVISRGLLPDEIESNNLWWNGPSFFSQPKSEWPQTIISINESDPDVAHEMKKTLKSSSSNDLFTYIETRYSNTRTLIRIFAIVRRFISNTRANSVKLTGSLSIDEIESAEVTIIKLIQQTFFSQEYKILGHQQNNIVAQHDQPVITHQLSRKSLLISLTPFLGDDGLIRVGGRIRASPQLTTNQKHPIVLPNCHFTTILVRELHMKFAHPGPLLLKSIVRERFYLVNAKSIIRKVIHGCLTCFRFKPSNTNQLMSDLPAVRVTMTPPFMNTAVDYTGFYNVRASMTKRSSSIKAYIALFKCMCTGAIHLELVSDLTTQAFIAAFDRFVSRRGLSITLFTDNATYFEGADNELQRIVKSMQNEVTQYCLEHAIKWNFTTPRAPHAGGIYESGIKSMKHHLKRVIGDHLYTFEQFTTILCKIEAIVNSRPITPISDDPNDLQVLTPGHFLTGRSLIAKPERNFLTSPRTTLNRWENLQKVQQHFWSLWYHDYLNTLQTRPVKFREKFEFNVGDLVLVKDANLPPLKWLIGRIVQVFPGKDKIIRNVRIITKLGEKDRHVKYLCFLPTEHYPTSDARESVPDGT